MPNDPEPKNVDANESPAPNRADEGSPTGSRADSDKPETDELLRKIAGRLRFHGILLFLLVLVVAVNAAAVYGSLVNYFAGDAAFFGGTTLGAAILGFVVGWIARRRA